MPEIPVVDHFGFAVDAVERGRLARLARRIRADEPGLADTGVFAADVSPGLGSGPAVLFEDHTEAGGFPGGHSPLEYRSLLLAATGDVVVVEGPRDPSFEAYCRDVLGLGCPEVVLLPPSSRDGEGRLARRCLHDAGLMRHLVDVARRSGTLNVIPYVGGDGAWNLAGAVARAAPARVRVAAAPPLLARRVNDKLWFATRVAEVLGASALPATYAAFGPAGLARRVGVLGRRFEGVVVKIPAGTGGLGNVVLSAADLRSLRPDDLQDRVMNRVRALGWCDSYPLIVGGWVSPVLVSPSVQLWIPLAEHGLPRIEGVFVQSLRGPAGIFVGAEPAQLPRTLTGRLVAEAARLATLLQALGYFGRCSFDSVVTGSEASPEVCWLECNARWGGVSTAMTLANRLTGDWARHPFVVVQRTGEAQDPRGVADLLERCGDHCFRRPREQGVVLLSPELLLRGTGINLMAIGPSLPAARAEADVAAELVAGKRSARRRRPTGRGAAVERRAAGRRRGRRRVTR